MALKALGNVEKKQLHRLATKDLFATGNRILSKTIKKIRRKAIQRKKRKFQLILMSIKYFETQMEYRRAILDSRIKKTKEKKMTFVTRDWEDEYRNDMIMRRQSSDNWVKNK